MNPETLLEQLAGRENIDDLMPPCHKGCAIVLNPHTLELKFVPLTCKSWACDFCSRTLADTLHARIRNAEPNKFITLTVKQTPDLTPTAAEDIIRTNWPKFVAAIRKIRPDFHYLRVLEYQKNGWPHLHVIARCHYIPSETLARFWHTKVLDGFVSIKAINSSSGIARELTKYIHKSFKLNAIMHKHRKAYTTSKKFFQDPPPKDDLQANKDDYVFMTSAPLDETLSLITDAHGIQGTFEVTRHTITLHPAHRYHQGLVDELLYILARLPWWKRSYNPTLAARPRSPPTNCTPQRHDIPHLIASREQLPDVDGSRRTTDNQFNQAELISR